MKTVLPPISGIRKVCGDQKIRETKYRFSRHVVRMTVDEGTLLFHTMTCEMLVIPREETEQQHRDELIRRWFMVPEDFDENRYVMQVRQVAAMLDGKKDAIHSFTVFTTTDCNARCAYCYELGRKREPMSDAVAMDAARYMAEVSKGEEVTITWFGGEPLYNARVIDLICGELTRRGVHFRCNMATNGYLLDEATVAKAVNRWNLTFVQITLDGTETNYNRIKAFIYEDDSPFRRVLDNIDCALKAGIEISVRLNVDAANAEDIKELIHLLGERFSGRKGFSVYHNMLLPFAGKIHEFEDDSSRTAAFFEILELIGHYGFARDRGMKMELIVQQCMADNDSCLTILPDGSLGKCEHFSETELIGNLAEGITDRELVSQWKETVEYPLCGECAMYPRCYHLKRCDWNKPICEGSRRDIRLECMRRDILKAYQEHKNS